MDTDKIRNLSDGELEQQERQAAEQLFRLRFNMKLGQNEGVKKLRELRKDVARIKTIARERQLGLHGEAPKGATSAPAKSARSAAAGEAGARAAARSGKKTSTKTGSTTGNSRTGKKTTTKGAR